MEGKTLTPIQELIKSIDDKLSLFSDFNREDRFNQGMFAHLEATKRTAIDLLQKEKQVIIDARMDGSKSNLDADKVLQYELVKKESEQYYSETFNQ